MTPEDLKKMLGSNEEEAQNFINSLIDEQLNKMVKERIDRMIYMFTLDIQSQDRKEKEKVVQVAKVIEELEKMKKFY